MTRKTSHFQKNEPILESILVLIRFLKIKKYIKRNSIVLDLGCGYNAKLLYYLSPQINKGVGYDIQINPTLKTSNITLANGRVDQRLPLKSNAFDTVIVTALIEHVDRPDIVLNEARRVLKKGGVLILTTPDKKSRLLLEILAFRLNLLSKQELKDHKRYYDKNSLQDALIASGFLKNKIEVESFELGFNLFAKAAK